MNAALGGLRTFKGVTCGDCNKMFAKNLDKVIAQDLAPLNSLAGVISRHRGTFVWTKATDQVTGHEYHLSAGRRLRQAAPIELPEVVEPDGTRRRSALFSDAEQERQWLDAVKAEGKDFTVVERRIQRAYFPRPLWLDVGLGGPESLRAIGRIAMNYLARYFPEIARAGSLQPFRDFVLGGSNERFVCFDYSWSDTLPPNTYTFGHRVVVGIRKNGNVIGAISFFGVFDLIISFGTAPSRDDAMQIVDVDPIASRKPDDMRELPRRACTLVTADETPAREAMLARRLADLKRRVADRNWNDDVPGLLCQVQECFSLDHHERESCLAAVLENQDPRILNLAVPVLDSIAEHAASTPNFPPVLTKYVQTLLAADASNQLGTAGLCLLAMVRNRIVELMLSDLLPLTEDRLREYLEGPLGYRAAYDAFVEVLESIFGQLRRPSERTDHGHEPPSTPCPPTLAAEGGGLSAEPTAAKR